MMPELDIVFAPRVHEALLVLLALAGAGLVVYAAWMRSPGAPFRALALAIALLSLANPAVLQEEREPLKDVAVVVLDRTLSQGVGDRTAQTDNAAKALSERLAAFGDTLDVRTVTVDNRPGGDGTEAFRALNEAWRDVPPERLAGAIVVTDGQVHDVPPAGALPKDVPVHALLTGAPGERDRKLTVVQAPRYGIVGEPMRARLRVDDFGAAPGGEAEIVLRIDGEEKARRRIALGADADVEFRLPHGGENVVEVEVGEGPAELTLQNNRAVFVSNGVRDRLRVLLISGKPHTGERTWRNLLKADPAVDLVHFTILRPPEKEDGTPIDELSLISFPARELFVDKLDEFDLIIFDRYQQRLTVPLPVSYFANIARYVESGGALLIAAGPDFVSPLSLYRTPLASVLPARPSGGVVEQGFKPLVTDEGARHPVTAGLPGANSGQGEPAWGRWFRLIETDKLSGETLMQGPGAQPLLILDRFGEGRVAQFLSDHAWLWSRGFEGGGPQAELLRRLAHWLMKEPDLEEEKLSASVADGQLSIVRRTMASEAAEVTVTRPDGDVQTVKLEAGDTPGRFTATLPAPQEGLYRLTHGKLTAVAAAGPLNPKEVADVRATADLLAPVSGASGGAAAWLSQDGVPQIRRTAPGRDAAGSGWIGLRENGAYAVTALQQRALLPPLLALVLIAGSLMVGWLREGR